MVYSMAMSVRPDHPMKVENLFDYYPKEFYMTDKTKRDRSNESYLYISPTHKAKLKAYADSTKRTMRAEAELWIDSLPLPK